MADCLIPRQVTAIWLIFEHSYGGFLAGRILMGFGAGAAETIGKSTHVLHVCPTPLTNPPPAPITIADIFFLHERGAVMSFYSAFLAVGVALGLIISGYPPPLHTSQPPKPY